MKSSFIAFIIMLGATALHAQNDIYLQINQMMAESAFDNDTPGIAPGDYSFTGERVDYYISGISLTHDGGMVTTLPDVHLLIKSEFDTNFLLGNLPIDDIESITFAIGVDPEHNHVDPSLYVGEPLGPQNPSMHWGWSSGYRFIAMEGVAGDGDFIYEIHSLGDENYYSQTHEVTAAANGNSRGIVLDADYSLFLFDLDMSEGGTFHNTLLPETIQIIENARDLVFTPGDATLSIVENKVTPIFAVAPNPSNEAAELIFENLEAGNTMLTIVDGMGKEVYTTTLLSQAGRFSLPDLAAGMYSIVLYQEGQSAYATSWIKQ